MTIVYVRGGLVENVLKDGHAIDYDTVDFDIQGCSEDELCTCGLAKDYEPHLKTHEYCIDPPKQDHS